MLTAEVRQQRCYLRQAEGASREHAQRAARLVTALDHEPVEFVDAGEDVLRAPVVLAAQVGETELAGGALQQPATGVFLQPLQPARRRGGRQPQLPAAACEAAELDGLDQESHVVDSIHLRTVGTRSMPHGQMQVRVRQVWHYAPGSLAARSLPLMVDSLIPLASAALRMLPSRSTALRGVVS